MIGTGKSQSSFSMVKLPRAETGDKRNIIMWNKRQRKTKRGRRLEDQKNEKISKLIWNLGTTPPR